MRWLLALVFCWAVALPAAAQQAPTPILILDSDQVFVETLYGRRIADELAQTVAELQAENDAIAETLRQEELSLTERRPKMDPEVFRAEAEAFDTKVQDVRVARDSKNQELVTAEARARAEFEERVQGIVANVMLERGAVLVMEQRNVVLSVRAANITAEVIARIDAELGDGTR